MKTAFSWKTAPSHYFCHHSKFIQEKRLTVTCNMMIGLHDLKSKVFMQKSLVEEMRIRFDILNFDEIRE